MSAPLIVGTTGNVTGFSLQSIRWRLAAELGYFGRGTVTTLASGLERERVILSSTFASDRPKPDHFDGLYVYVTGGDQAGVQRQLMDGAYEGPTGAFQVDYPYAEPLALQTPFELGALPAVTYLGQRGLNEIIALALEQLPVVDLVEISGVTGQLEYSLSSLPWPIKRIEGVYDSRASAQDPRRRSMQRAELLLDAESPTLVLSHGFTTGSTFWLKVTRGAHTRIKQAGTWGDSVAGPVDDSDCVLYEPRTVVAQAKPIALRQLAAAFPIDSKERAKLEGEADVLDWAAKLSRFHNSFRGSGAQRAGAR